MVIEVVTRGEVVGYLVGYSSATGFITLSGKKSDGKVGYTEDTVEYLNNRFSNADVKLSFRLV